MTTKAPNINPKAIIVAIVVIALVYFFLLKPKKVAAQTDFPAPYQQPTGGATAPTPTSFAQSSPTESLNGSKIMKRGDRGINVRYIQLGINRYKRLKNSSEIAVDESFGPQTERAMQEVINSKTGSYNQVKAAVIKAFANEGKSNPYLSGSTGSETSSSEAASAALGIAALSNPALLPLSWAASLWGY